jgi:hypothetical protein
LSNEWNSAEAERIVKMMMDDADADDAEGC